MLERSRMVIKSRYSRFDIRKTNAGMYHAIMTFGLVEIALSFNFWFTTPTFNPYNISKDLIGVVFMILGLMMVLFLNLYKDYQKVRFWLATSIGFTFFWGIANTQQFFLGKSSLQLPILFLGFCAAQMWWLIESPINPTIKKHK